MLRDTLGALVHAAAQRLVESGHLAREALSVDVEISDTKQPEHGDFACNFAMAAAKLAGANPRELGEWLRAELLELDQERMLTGVEVAGPGFLNFRLKPEAISAAVPALLQKGEGVAHPNPPKRPLKINVEFVSVNPNGPITIGSGRGAAYGSTLCNVLQAAGHEVHREYYINDGVNSEQMRLFAESVRALATGEPVPENGYKGDYVADVAELLSGQAAQPIQFWQSEAQRSMLDAQKRDLAAFGVEFDTWFSEQSLHDSRAVAEELNALVASGVADEQPRRTKLKLAKGGRIEEVEFESQGDIEDETDAHSPQEAGDPDAGELSPTLWLRSTKFGDDMDRVLRRKDGRLTYIASDVAYHRDKFNRPANADKLITVLGPDHHGYIGRLTAVVAAMLLAEGKVDYDRSDRPLDEVEAKLYESPGQRDACRAALELARQKLEVQIFQLVRFLKDGKPAPMRKRDGNIYALIDLVKEIGAKVRPDGTDEEKLTAGKDIARFFYLSRSHETTFDFDLDLAERASEDNPAAYPQYAHARICSVVAKAEEAGLTGQEFDASMLSHPRELALIKKIADLPWEVQRCAADYGVHRLTTYATELGRLFHVFYGECKVIQQDQPELSAARLALCKVAANALKAALGLLGISAPERM